VRPAPDTYTTICEDFSEQTVEFHERLFRLLERALAYTTASLALYRDKYALQPVLSPPDEYLHSCEEDENNQSNEVESCA
jgi:hypothetical protein